MTQLGKAYGLIDEHEERIFELEGFARDDSNRIAELEEPLHNTLCLKDSIEETSTLDLSKMMGERDHALCKLKEFMDENDNIMNGHNELLKDFEHLEKAHMALSRELDRKSVV